MFHQRVSLLVCKSFKLITSDWQSTQLSLLMTQHTASTPGCSQSPSQRWPLNWTRSQKCVLVCVWVCSTVPLFDRLAPLLQPVPADYLRIWNNGNGSTSSGHRAILSDPFSSSPNPTFLAPGLINTPWNNNIFTRMCSKSHDSKGELFIGGTQFCCIFVCFFTVIVLAYLTD